MPPVRFTSIFVTTRFTQFHRWPEAPASVAYLASLHRHVFHVRLELPVTSEGRQLEYHTVLGLLNGFIEGDLHFNWNETDSCETIARKILEWAEVAFPGRPKQELIEVQVSEDGENGSAVYGHPR